jgi:hypothetical protein
MEFDDDDDSIIFKDVQQDLKNLDAYYKTRPHYKSADQQCTSKSCKKCKNQTKIRQEYGISDMFCAMCGRRDVTLQRRSETPPGYGLIDLFCKEGECFERYGKCLGTTTADLSMGLPYLWTKVKTTTKYFCQIPARKFGANGKLIDLQCTYCTRRNPLVLSHPLVPKKYGATSFCPNSECFSSFCSGVNNVKRLQRSPFNEDADENRDTAATIEEMSKLSSKKKKVRFDLGHVTIWW